MSLSISAADIARAAEREHVDVHGAGNVPLRVQLPGRGIQQEHIVALQVLLEPAGIDEMAAGS